MSGITTRVMRSTRSKELFLRGKARAPYQLTRSVNLLLLSRNQILLIQRPLVDRLFSKVANTYNKSDIFDVDDLVACRQHICTSDCR